ncbi:hypothetical protein ACUOA8_20635 [Escherichia sp. SS-MK2]
MPVGGGVSDCYTRVMLKVEELRQNKDAPYARRSRSR